MEPISKPKEDADVLYSEAQTLAWETPVIWFYLFLYGCLTTLVGILFLACAVFLLVVFVPPESPPPVILFARSAIESYPYAFVILCIMVLVLHTVTFMFIHHIMIGAITWNMIEKAQGKPTAFLQGIKNAIRPAYKHLGAHMTATAYDVRALPKYSAWNKTSLHTVTTLKPSQFLLVGLVMEDAPAKEILEKGYNVMRHAGETYTPFVYSDIKRMALGCATFIIAAWGLGLAFTSKSFLIGIPVFIATCIAINIYNLSQRLFYMGLTVKLYVRFKDAPPIESVEA